jgi:hypothetical protein
LSPETTLVILSEAKNPRILHVAARFFASLLNAACVGDIMEAGTPVDKTIRKVASFEEMKDDEYRYWHSVSPAERFAVGHQMSVEGYRAYGYSANGAELKRVAVRIEQARC